ncbi:MAG: signal peptide peptidase SppA [Xanthomonadales bacterium]|nr:signal peptide peptidase SppA [Xanthomonadales bacterium]
MTATRPGPVRRFLVGTWRTLDFTRRFILTVLFLFLVAVLLAAALKAPLKVQPRSVLVIAPVGQLVEEYSASAIDRALARMTGQDVPEVRLRDLLRALDAAAGDDRIERVLLRLDRFAGGGLASLREVGGAIDRVRASGKEVIAYGDSFGQGGYYLAARAGEVYLHPFGIALVEGLGRFRTYYARAFEKLGIEVRLFRVGEFKSAGEPYIRNEASPEALEADRYWMNDLWQRWLAEVGQARGLAPAALQASVDGFPERLEAAAGDFARVTLEAGLVDDLKTADQVRALLIERGVADRDGHSFRQVSMADYLEVLGRENGADGEPGAPVAIVVAEGEIIDGETGGGMVGGVSTSALIRAAREDEDVRALVLRVDSPGGGVFPSEQIRREVELTRAAGKTVVVSMGDLAASGGYWISMDADRIVADPSTITGSIGVFGLWFNAPETMDRLGLNTDGTGTTALAGLFDPTRPFDPRAGRIIQSSVDNFYREFIGKISAARGQAADAVDQVARGRVWSGAQAHERGLVDQLGGLQDALAHARSLAGLPDDAPFRYVERELGTFERFMQNLGGSALAHAARGAGLYLPGTWLPEGVRSDLARAQALVTQRGQLPWSVQAHCLCGGD